ncbi:MAG: hypothetical protein WBL84_25460, partial [Xanthobacteraceae bacterium]
AHWEADLRAFEAERAAARSEPPAEAEPRKRHRRLSLAAALKQADKAGKPVRGAVIAPSGEFTLQFGEPEKPEGNAFDKWKAKRSVKLTRFRGHRNICLHGVHDGEDETPLLS